MPPVQFVSARGLERARRHAARLVEERPDHDGWSVDRRSAGLLVRAFSRLRLRPDLRLVTYARRDGIGGTGWTFAVPAHAETPPVEEVAAPGRFEPRSPPGARPHFMEAVVGDGSLRSFAQASVLGREISELGAWWHGLDWSTHMLIGPSADGRKPAVFGRSLYSVPASGIVVDEEWSWPDGPPKDWRPRAERTGNRVTVTFWSYSELGRSAVYEHRDVYGTAASLVPDSVGRRVVGEGSGGFVF